MASTASHVSFLPPILTFCGAAVVAVPVFRLLGLSAVLGYLAAGVAIGPSGLSLVEDPETIATVAELGVVLLLFIIGLELKLSHLWEMKRDIFGLGLAQLTITAILLGSAAMAIGFSPPASFVTGVAVALSATAIALQMLGERNDLPTPYGQRSFAILLFQDLSVVPLLAILPLLASRVGDQGSVADSLLAVGEALLGIIAVVLIGRYGLNPFFRILARSGAREVMTASALLVVLGAALLMQEVGLSMAMGAFLAGLLLAESNFRHQLEADIEPFRGMLLGLFFMSVGMSIDAGVVRQQWPWLLLVTAVVLIAKIAIVAVLFRLFRSPWRDAVRGGALLAPAGEFAFVLLPLGAGLALLSPLASQLLTAVAALTMFLGPLVAKGLDLALESIPDRQPDPDIDTLGDTHGQVIVVGFGRFGQVVNQVLLAEEIDVTVIDNNVDRIRAAAAFGFRVYYGDGRRLDVLRAAGVARAKLVCICVDDRQAALKIVEILHEEFPQAGTYVRAYDRIHAIDLMNLDVDYQLRETFESALAFSRATLEELGREPDKASAVVDDVRRRDVARLIMQKAEGIMGGADMLHGARLAPQPLTDARKRAHGLTEETRDIIGEDGDIR